MIVDQIIKQFRDEKRQKKPNERHSRSLLKALSWRFIGTIDTILLSWIISGKLTVAFSIGLLELFTKTILYYFHERIWTIIKWGK